MKVLTGAVVVVVSMLALSACGGSQRDIASPALVAVHSTLPAPLMKRLAAEARGTARSLGDTSIKTAQVYGPDSRYLLVKASSGDLVQKTPAERKGFYLIVLHGHFVCHGCSRPPGSTAKPPRGKIATEVWSPKTGQTDFGLGNRPVAMSHLRGSTVITLAAAPSTVRAAERKRAASQEAERLLHEFIPPPGARPTREPQGYGGVLRRSGPEPPAKVVDVHRFWSVQRSLKAVAAFVRAHQVRGFKSSGAEYGTNVPHYLTWSFVWPTGSHPVPSRRLLNVTAVRLPGRTVLRVDAKAVWIYPRSPSEKVPSGVREIVLHTPKVHVRVTDRAKVQRIVRWFDALPISPPGVATLCPLVPGSDITLSFRSPSGLSLAQGKLPPTSAGICNPISFKIGEHPQAPLIDRYGPLRESFVGRLQRLLGVRLLLTYR